MTQIKEVLQRRLIFVGGKGGVGKTVVSRAIARSLARSGARTLWATFEDPSRAAGELRQVHSALWELNCDASVAFQEYASMKIGGARLAKVFLQNKLIQYLAKAAPGIHELVLLGKVWFEREHYDHVVVDMPSTGYGLAMFQSAENFNRLFRGGPLHRDAAEMLEIFNDASVCGHLIVALPEEMPLQEALELDEFLRKLFPKNPAAFLVNRRFPLKAETSGATADGNDPDSWSSPLAVSVEDYARKRAVLEEFNLRLWTDRKIPYSQLDFVPTEDSDSTIDLLARQIQDRGLL